MHSSFTQTAGPAFALNNANPRRATRVQLDPGQSAAFALKVVAEVGTITNTAAVTSAIADPDGSDDSASATTTVTAPAGPPATGGGTPPPATTPPRAASSSARSCRA